MILSLSLFRSPPPPSLTHFILFLFQKSSHFLHTTRNVMQCPLLVLDCRWITRRKATESSTTSPRESNPTEYSFRVAPYARGACAPMAVTMASTRLQGRAPSEPGFENQREVPLFPPQFHHFWTLSETDDHLDCLNQTLLCPFMQKKLGPLESGTESKKKRLFGLA